MPILSFASPTSVVSLAALGAFALSGLSVWASRLEGLKVVCEDDSPEIDIVCVHGLNGHPVETWTSRENGKPVNWIKDYLQGHVGKRIRILTYSYSSELFIGSQGGFLSDSLDAQVLKYLPQALHLHSRRLLEQLADSRGGAASKRRVLFIAHSLGGLIVKSALVQASAVVDDRDARRLKAIELLTIGVLFFGTPQREMKPKKWNFLLESMLRAVGAVPFYAALNPSAEQAELLNLQIERYKSIESNFLNFSFIEGIKDQLESREFWVVYPGASEPKRSRNTTWQSYKLHKSHKNLAKFESDLDEDFKTVISCIDQCLKQENYDKADYRYSAYFDRKDSPVASKTNLPSSMSAIQEKRVKVEHELYRVESSESSKNVKEKRKSLKEVLKISEENIGVVDNTTLNVVRKVAHCAFDAGAYEEADAFYKRLFVSAQADNPCSAETAAVLENMAEVAEQQGCLADATKDLRRARAVYHALGRRKDSREMLKVSTKIASLCESRGSFDEALEEYNSIIATLNDEPITRPRKPGLLEFKPITRRRSEINARMSVLKARQKVRGLIDSHLS